MIDFSDNLKDNDIHFENTSLYKIRNILKTSVGENPYNPDAGVDLTSLYQSDRGMAKTLPSEIGKLLFSQYCDVSSFSLEAHRGLLQIQITAPQRKLSHE